MKPATHSELELAAVPHPYRGGIDSTVATPTARPLPRVSCAIGDGRHRVVRTHKELFVVERLTRDAMGVERWTHVCSIDAPDRDTPVASDRHLLFVLLNDIDVIRHGSVP